MQPLAVTEGGIPGSFSPSPGSPTTSSPEPCAGTVKERRLEQIADEVERLEGAGGWNLDQFRRLYAAALEACEGEERQLEFFGPFLRGASYIEEAVRLGNEYRSAA